MSFVEETETKLALLAKQVAANSLALEALQRQGPVGTTEVEPCVSAKVCAKLTGVRPWEIYKLVRERRVPTYGESKFKKVRPSEVLSTLRQQTDVEGLYHGERL